MFFLRKIQEYETQSVVDKAEIERLVKELAVSNDKINKHAKCDFNYAAIKSDYDALNK